MKRAAQIILLLAATGCARVESTGPYVEQRSGGSGGAASPAPELSSFLLLSAGLAVLAVRRRKER